MLDFTSLTISPFSYGGHLPETSVPAVKITHNPTGISVTCRRHATWEANRDEALMALERMVIKVTPKRLDK